MSAFLGPIHQKMYSRILYQDFLTEIMLTLAREKGWDNKFKATLDKDYPSALKEPLEDIIDPNNIHHWLNESVENNERRFATTASNLLSEYPERLADIEISMTELGCQSKVANETNAELVYASIHDLLLDGMPCDFPFELTQSNENTVIWKVKNCPHVKYWEELESDAETYYFLRDALVKGMLEGSEFIHRRDADACHSITRRI